MAKNRQFEEGDSLSLPVPEGTKSGGPVAVGKIPGVAVTDRDTAGNATVDMDGVYKLSVEGKEKEGKEKAIEVGDIIYIKEGKLSVDETGTRFGYALGKVTKAKTEEIPVKIGY